MRRKYSNMHIETAHRSKHDKILLFTAHVSTMFMKLSQLKIPDVLGPLNKTVFRTCVCVIAISLIVLHKRRFSSCQL